MPPPIKLSVVFLNFNRITETRYTVEQLKKLCGQRIDIEIIAVDNGSTDGTAEYLQKQEILTPILLKDNTGISGYNQGFERAQGEFILVLDDDSCPAEFETIDRTIDTLDRQPDIGVIACRIVTPDGKDQWSWHLPVSQSFSPSPFFIGCGFVIRRSLFKQIGWYPGRFFLYQNEIDVSFKTRLHGYSIYYDPNCKIIHRGTPNQRPGWRRIYYPTRNTIWLLRRYYPQPEASYMIFSRILIGFLRALTFRELPNYFKALRDAFRIPVEKSLLPAELRKDFAPFWKQNSIFHQLLRKT